MIVGIILKRGSWGMTLVVSIYGQLHYDYLLYAVLLLGNMWHNVQKVGTRVSPNV